MTNATSITSTTVTSPLNTSHSFFPNATQIKSLARKANQDELTYIENLLKEANATYMAQKIEGHVFFSNCTIFDQCLQKASRVGRHLQAVLPEYRTLSPLCFINKLKELCLYKFTETAQANCTITNSKFPSNLDC